MAALEYISSTTTTITVAVTGLQYHDYQRSFRWYLSTSGSKPGSPVSTTLLGAGSSNDAEITLGRTNALTPGTTYYVWVDIYGGQSGSTYLAGLGALSVTTENIVISEWSWSSSNGNATKAQTIAAGNSLYSGGSLSNFSHVVWNDLVDKVAEVIEARGLTWLTTCPNKSNQSVSIPNANNTKIKNAPYELTAAKFNALRHNVGSRESTGVYYVNPGDQVKAIYFTKIVDALNTWINNE